MIIVSCKLLGYFLNENKWFTAGYAILIREKLSSVFYLENKLLKKKLWMKSESYPPKWRADLGTLKDLLIL